MSVLHALRRSAQLSLEIRKSRFLVQAERVDSPDQAMASLKRMSDPLATHNCWAWLACRWRDCCWAACLSVAIR